MGSGIGKNLNILLITSQSPYKSANLGQDVIMSLTNAGHYVEVLTKYLVEGLPVKSYAALEYFEPNQKEKSITLFSRLKGYFPLLRYFHKPAIFAGQNHNNIFFVCKNERTPVVDPQLFVNKIKDNYDLVVILFWQDMLTSKSILEIFNKLKSPIFLMAVDMAPLTGGCIYFWSCKRFLGSCGCCPGLFYKNRNDFTHLNFEYKKDVYSRVKCMYLGNTWMTSFAQNSPLLSNNKIRKSFPVINEKEFVIHDKLLMRKQLGIKPEKKYVIFAGAASIATKSKGFEYLVKSVNIFTGTLTKKEKSEVLLLLAGNIIPGLKNYFKVEILELGFLDSKTLAKAFSASDLFVSPSIQDAGPSMVNQSLMCGTPVVAFKIGVALDLVLTDRTGYCANYKDLKDFSNGIRSMYKKTSREIDYIINNCRELALSAYSYEAFSDSIVTYYNDFIEDTI